MLDIVLLPNVQYISTAQGLYSLLCWAQCNVRKVHQTKIKAKWTLLTDFSYVRPQNDIFLVNELHACLYLEWKIWIVEKHISWPLTSAIFVTWHRDTTLSPSGSLQDWRIKSARQVAVITPLPGQQDFRKHYSWVKALTARITSSSNDHTDSIHLKKKEYNLIGRV